MIPGIPSVGGTEILILLVIVLMLFGAKRIPELARGLGNGVREFREGISGKEHGGQKKARDRKEDDELYAAEEARDRATGDESVRAERTGHRS